eukprot:Phypoly_transcript_12165.p1 GENE.Phypoly_transcript_12165~~Phypoly_transcript_12165.p1  ORF type:complete len:333 (+),score=15.74 Phypoly_transcript_12165:108-1001(+)
MSLAVSSVCNIVSTIACFSAASVLLYFKRSSKVVFRLEIGLFIAFGINHFMAFLMLFKAFDYPEKRHVPYYIVFCLRIITLGATIHYLIAIYFNFLLKCEGWTEERMKNIERRIHFLCWGVPPSYTISIFYHNFVAFIFILCFLGFQAMLIVVCTIVVVKKQQSEFSKHSEVLSSLVTARSKKILHSFFRRFLVLTFVTILIFLQALLFLPEIRTFIERTTKTQYITAVFPLDGLVISVLLTTTPDLIALYKQRYTQWTSAYEPLPRSPYIEVEHNPPFVKESISRVSVIRGISLSS